MTQTGSVPSVARSSATVATVTARAAEVPARSRFLILTRRAETAAHNLQTVLAPLGRCELVVDQPDAPGLWIPNTQLTAFKGLMGGAHFPVLTAWSRAFYHASQTLEEDELIWFVEEDVAGDAAAFATLVRITEKLWPDLSALHIGSQRHAPNWPWWPVNRNWFARPWKSFNPLCALSPTLMREILTLQSAKKQLLFHELLFASAAMQARMKVLDWDRQPQLAPYFEHFSWRPLITETVPGISHPVKDPQLHTLISLR